MADVMKLDVKERMKIQMTPWDESDVIQMKDLYTRLTIEKHTKIPHGHGLERTCISDENETNVEYAKLFEGQAPMLQRILVKGYPGIGKTTFLQKVAWDWAKEIFKSFAMVFLIVLKFVAPSDSIAKMITQQNGILEGSKFDSKSIEDILDQHGEECLILLDGYDEIPENVTAITQLLEKRIYPKCNIMLTSRPNVTKQIQNYFTTIASVEGFSKEKATEYMGKVLHDKRKADAVMEYSATNEIVDMWRYPVLVMFLCLLVNERTIDIDTERLSLDELYTRLLDLLYKRYTVRANVIYKEEDREDMISKLGKIALEGLKKKTLGILRSFVIHEVGEKVFEYGILIADTDRRILHGTDIAVFFPHKTIQEFLAAKYLVCQVQQRSTTVSKLLKTQEIDFVGENIIFLILALDMAGSITKDCNWIFWWRATVSNQLKKYIKSTIARKIKNKCFCWMTNSTEASALLNYMYARCNLKMRTIKFIQNPYFTDE